MFPSLALACVVALGDMTGELPDNPFAADTAAPAAPVIPGKSAPQRSPEVMKETAPPAPAAQAPVQPTPAPSGPQTQTTVTTHLVPVRVTTTTMAEPIAAAPAAPAPGPTATLVPTTSVVPASVAVAPKVRQPGFVRKGLARFGDWLGGAADQRVVYRIPRRQIVTNEALTTFQTVTYTTAPAPAALVAPSPQTQALTSPQTPGKCLGR